jgi:hybrid cluster-associated redox disulfide protein
MRALRRTIEIDFGGSVDDLMRQCPQTIGVFLELRMKCVGCPIGKFHTIEDSCREHRVDRTTFIAALQRVTMECE